MDVKKLREIEGLFRDLKGRLDAGEIAADDMKAELKKLMIRDDDNRFWMIGSKTGGWYVYDGSTWKSADPYGHEPTPLVLQAEMRQPPAAEPAAAAAAEFLQKEETDQDVLCKFCHSRLKKHDAYCNFCGGNQKAQKAPAERKLPDGDLLIKAVRIPALLFFLGGLGLIIGVISGAVFGIFNVLGDLIFQFPMMLQEMRGKIQGGLFFGALGGISGFLIFAVLAVLGGLFFNLIAFVFGGLRFKIKT